MPMPFASDLPQVLFELFEQKLVSDVDARHKQVIVFHHLGMRVLYEVSEIYKGQILFFEGLERSEFIPKGEGDPLQHALRAPQPQHSSYHTQYQLKQQFIPSSTIVRLPSFHKLFRTIKINRAQTWQLSLEIIVKTISGVRYYRLILLSAMEKVIVKTTCKAKTNDYGDSIYWDTRYANKKDQRFEWLEPYPRLKPYIQACLPRGKESVILNIGCGNSTIQEELYADGYRHIVNNDISAVVIDQMRRSQEQKGLLQMVYDVMDVRSMSYPDESFDLVIDKSTIDSLMCSDHPLLNVAKMLEEGYRVLRKGGYFLTISYSDSRLEHFLRQHVRFEAQHKQIIRVDEKGFEVKNHLYICKKMGMEPLSKEQQQHFYSKLKEIQEKEYPPA